MTIEFNFPDNVIAICFDFDGVKVQLDKRGEDSYEINIYDPENRFCDGKLPVNYTYLNTNRIHCEEYPDIWWCCGIHDIFGSGDIINGSRYESEHINIILQAIQNGLDELERLNKPEIIKIGNVTITKQNMSCNKVMMSVDGLINVNDYPRDVSKEYIAYSGDICVKCFMLYDGDCSPVPINGLYYYPRDNFVLSNEDYNKVIKIITESEKKLAEYNKIKVGDKVQYPMFGSWYEGYIRCIDKEWAWICRFGCIDHTAHDTILVNHLKKV